MKAHSHRTSVLLLTFPWVAACAFAACRPERVAGAMELQRALVEGGRIEIIVPDGDGSPLWDLGRRFRKDILTWGRRGPREPGDEDGSAWSVDVSDGHATRLATRLANGTDAGARPGMRFVIGLSSHPEIARLAEGLGAEFPASGGFRILGRDHTGAGDALLASTRDPDRPGLPLILLMGNRATELARIATDLPTPWFPSLRTWTQGGPGLCVERSGGTLDRAAERASLAGETRLPAVDRLRVHLGPEVDAERAAAYLDRCRAAAARVETWLDAELETDIEIHLYAHAGDLERTLGSEQLAHLDRASLNVHALLAPGLPDDGGAAVARATALALGGVPRQEWLLDGIGPAAAGSWWGRPLEEWVSLLRSGGLLPARDRASLASARRHWSEHALVPRRATMVLDRIEDAGGGMLVDLWRTDDPISPLAADDRIGGEYPERLEPLLEEREARRARVLTKPERFFRGVSVFGLSGSAGGSGHESHAGRELAASLHEAREAGARACAFWVDAACDIPGPLLPARRSVVGSVSDVALAAACAEGERLGLLRMLALNPLDALGGSWVDGGDSIEPEDIDELFDRLARITLHYALLAELCRVDLLSLGAGLRKASLTADRGRETDYTRRVKEMRRSRWRELIREVRAAFGGALTYAAYLRREVDQVAFWDDLDFIGLLALGPLGEADFSTDSAIEDELWSEFQKARSLALEWKRPALFVQLGFPARESAWQDWSWGRGVRSDREQERYYAALEAVLGRQPLFKTRIPFFLWNWPLTSGEPRPDFSPRGRPAGAHVESILRRP